MTLEVLAKEVLTVVPFGKIEIWIDGALVTAENLLGDGSGEALAYNSTAVL